MKMLHFQFKSNYWYWREDGNQSIPTVSDGLLKLKLEKGERLFIFSDGIPEAMNKDEEEYSDEKLEKFFVEETPENAEEFINAIVTDVKLHTRGEIQSDDITAIYLIRK